MKKILVIGSTNMDFVIRLDTMPSPGETLLCRSFERIPGGKGANQAYACGMLGGRTSFLSAVGQDDFGGYLVENLKKAGVDCSHVVFSGCESTGLAVICVDARGDNSIVVVSGANSLCTKDYIQSMDPLLEEADIVMAQLEVPLEGVCYALERAAALGKITILNPAPAPAALPEALYRSLRCVTPNETELQRLAGRRIDTAADAAAAAGVLLEKGAENVIVTLGGKGALLKNRETERLFAPPDVPVADTTAAGDTFNAAIAVRLAEGASLEEAIPFANAAASLAVSRRGAQTSIPSRAEVDRFLESRGAPL